MAEQVKEETRMNEKGRLGYYIDLAGKNDSQSVDAIMKDLRRKMTLEQSKFIDYALGLIDSEDGTQRMQHYLFNGTQIQRNYCALYFGRLDEYGIIRQAYEKGLIDAKQAFSR